MYNQPYATRRVTFGQIKELDAVLRQPPHHWTPDRLWQAFAQVEQGKVRGVGAKRTLTDLVALVRHAVHCDDELVPYPDQVRARYERWLADQAAAGRTFTPEQRWWPGQIAQHVGVNMEIAPDDFDYGVFHHRGGRLGALRALGSEWLTLLDELNALLAA
jgi:type I restriction enzyme R subunit